MSENFSSEIKHLNFFPSNVPTVIISIIKANRLLVCVCCEGTAVTLVSYSVSVTILLIRIGRERTVVLRRNENEKHEVLAGSGVVEYGTLQPMGVTKILTARWPYVRSSPDRAP